MSQSYPVYTRSVTAAAAIPAARFVGFSKEAAGAAANTLGVSHCAALTGETLPVIVLGTAVVEAGDAITEGALIETDAQSRAIPKTTGPAVARALQSASAAGERIEVLLIAN